MDKYKHRWVGTESMWSGQEVQRCDHCATERTRDTSTRSLYLYRRGRAEPPSKRPLTDEWSAYKAGVTPKCTGPVVSP